MEAFASGLGVVVSEWATANLDLNKEFISVVPENKILLSKENKKEEAAKNLVYQNPMDFKEKKKFKWLNGFLNF